ncbi:restriction endonuclease subunit S [Helicobacter sp. T3_23-1059]
MQRAWQSTKKTIDCHESAITDSRNDTPPCHTHSLYCHTERSEVSQKSTNRVSSLTAFAQNDNKGNHRDISLSTKSQYDNNGESLNFPQGWTIKTLGEIGEIVSGGTPSTTQADNFGGNIAWITPADLSNHNDKFISQGKRNISEKGLKSSSARLVPKGTILFSSRAPIGYVAIASNSLCTNQGFKSLIPKENVFSEFVYYYLLNAKSLAESYASGTTFKEISAKSFSKLPIPLPPLEIQKKIVEILEKHFSSADKTSAFIDSALKNAKQLKSSLLKSAFMGKLT